MDEVEMTIEAAVRWLEEVLLDLIPAALRVEFPPSDEDQRRWAKARARLEGRVMRMESTGALRYWLHRAASRRMWEALDLALAGLQSELRSMPGPMPGENRGRIPAIVIRLTRQPSVLGAVRTALRPGD